MSCVDWISEAVYCLLKLYVPCMYSVNAITRHKSYTYHKVSVSFYVVGHISLNQKVVNSMGSNSSIVRVVDSTVSNIRACHTSTEVKVHCIATQSECLTTVAYLSMFNSVIERKVHTKLICLLRNHLYVYRTKQ